jgi:hypothetical protein
MAWMMNWQRPGAAGRDWPRYAEALDMRLGGAKLDDIAQHFGVTRSRAQQLVLVAKQQLAYRVFKGVPRPLPKASWEKNNPSLQPPPDPSLSLNS